MIPLPAGGPPLAGGRPPAVCAPLLPRTGAAPAAESAAVAAKQPDRLEWRVDFFEAIADRREVRGAAADLRSASGGIPVLFTGRGQREGGQPIPLAEPEVLALYEAVAASG